MRDLSGEYKLPKGRLIGIDLGLKRVGLSISDDLGCFAHPLATIPYTNLGQLVEEITDIAAAREAVGFVVGFPRNMGGSLGEPARRSLNFARKLEARSGLPVVLWDERLSTSQAEREMIGLGMSRRRRRRSIDQAASVLILENYLRSVGNTPRNPKGSENVKDRNGRKNDGFDEEQVYDDVIVLTDEDGNEEEFKLLLDDLFVEDRQYVVLMPVEGGDEDPEIVILRVEYMGGDEVTLCTIDDEEEWEEVIEALGELDLESDIEVEDYPDDEEDEDPGI